MEELLVRHRKEQKDLQGRVTSKKKNATKKNRKGVNDECETLERELKERHQAEIQVLAPPTLEDDAAKLDPDEGAEAARDVADDVEKAQDVSRSAEAATATRASSTQPQADAKKPNRQKARLARRAAEQEAEMVAAAEEAANMPDQRQQEISAMKAQMDTRRLAEIMIRPDGHCLYSACAQTIADSSAKDYKQMRAAAADFMKAHKADFEPFMEESIDTYTEKIKTTAEWGGHLELQAIAKSFKLNINVLQASGHVERVGSETASDQEIWLAYYKHSFGLGEHYNALKPIAPA